LGSEDHHQQGLCPPHLDAKKSNEIKWLVSCAQSGVEHLVSHVQLISLSWQMIPLVDGLTNKQQSNNNK
jgi:hypothetical protein